MSDIIDSKGVQVSIRRELKKLKTMHGEVGIRGEARASDGTKIVGYALANEFGSPAHNIPERSFFRSTVKEKRDRWLDLLQNSAKDILDLQKVSASKAFKRVGEVAVGDIKKKITSNIPPQNAPSTKRAKGGSEGAITTTLIDTGAMRSSVNFKIVS